MPELRLHYRLGFLHQGLSNIGEHLHPRLAASNFRRRQWKFNGKCCAFSTSVALRTNSSCLLTHQVIHDCQAKTETTVRPHIRSIYLTKTLENVRQVFRRNSNSAIGYFQSHV